MALDAKNIRKWKQILMAGALVLAGISLPLQIAESSNSATAGGDVAQLTFKTPEEAGEALEKAAKAGDQTTLSQILGQDANALLVTGDTDSDKAAMAEFSAKFDRMNRWVKMTDGSRVLYIGADNFAFPVPLGKQSSGRWSFDSAAGAREIKARNIGRNELLTIDACTALANAQEIYYKLSGSSPEFARRIISTPGHHDGLYWPTQAPQYSSPLGQLGDFPKSSLTSSPTADPLVIDGYALRVLTAQGDNASGGARSYISNGKMTGGFAFIATPVNYGESGIMTFMISEEGIVFERDLGPGTKDIAASIEQYNPDENWAPAE